MRDCIDSIVTAFVTWRWVIRICKVIIVGKSCVSYSKFGQNGFFESGILVACSKVADGWLDWV